MLRVSLELLREVRNGTSILRDTDDCRQIGCWEDSEMQCGTCEVIFGVILAIPNLFLCEAKAVAPRTIDDHDNCRNQTTLPIGAM